MIFFVIDLSQFLPTFFVTHEIKRRVIVKKFSLYQKNKDFLSRKILRAALSDDYCVSGEAGQCLL